MEKTGTFLGKIRDREIASTYRFLRSNSAPTLYRRDQIVPTSPEDENWSYKFHTFSRVFLQQISNVLEEEDRLIDKLKR